MSVLGLVVLGCESSSTEIGGGSNALTANDGSTGVAECDLYLDRYELCMKAILPAHQVNQQQTGIRRQRATWKSLAESDPKRRSLSLICQDALVTAREEFPSCTWS